MRKLITAVLALGLLASVAFATRARAFDRPVFRDDFNGTSLDLSKWQPNWLGPNNTAITPPINGAEESCYDPSMVSVSGGYLHLRSAQRPCTDDKGHTWQYASGMVNSYAHFQFTHGAMRARVFLPGSTSTTDWPAFWADGVGPWPKSGEIDVLEGLNGHDCFHFHYTGGAPGGCPALASQPGWHTVSAVWHAGQINFWYDTAKVGHIDQGITDVPMYVVFNLALSKAISPPVVPNSEMLVDWVEVVQ